MIPQNDLRNTHSKEDREDLNLIPIKEATITYLQRASIPEYNQTWYENFAYVPFGSYYTRDVQLYVLERKKTYFGVLESPYDCTATYVFLLLSKNNIEKQIQIIKNDIENKNTTRNGVKSKFYIGSISENNKIRTYSLKENSYYLGKIAHKSFSYWYKKLHDIIMPIAKQRAKRKNKYGIAFNRHEIKTESETIILYNKNLSQISEILNIEVSLLIKLLKRKSPYSNITESYIMSNYEIEIYRDLFIKLLHKNSK